MFYKHMGMFKGVSKNDNYPYAKFYKGVYAYADYLNHSSVPFVTGMVEMNLFQIDTTIIAGKTFYKYAKHYFDFLEDIRNNDEYEGYFINDNDIVKTLEEMEKATDDEVVDAILDEFTSCDIDRDYIGRLSAWMENSGVLTPMEKYETYLQAA